MINELHQLSNALQEANIPVDIWHDEYLEIPNITPKDPCIRVVIDGDRVAKLESVVPEKKENIKKYGNNQGSFPAMNLAPLFCISDETQIKEIQQMQTGKEEIDIEKIKSWCVENNWLGAKFEKRYHVSFVARTKELREKFQEEMSFEPAIQLIQASVPFSDPAVLHRALKDAAIKHLCKKKRDSAYLALYLLFELSGQKPKEKQSKKEKATKNISVVLDTKELEKNGYSTVSSEFVTGMNRALLAHERKKYESKEMDAVDALGQPFVQVGKRMPEVKLAAGFSVSLRTMFSEKPCQTRYGKIEDGSYPISYEERLKLAGALRWIGDKERKNRTWVALRKKEALFAFPSRFGDELPSMTDSFVNDAFGEALFEAKSKDFIDYLRKTKITDPEHAPKWIEFFVLRNVDDTSTRGKVTFSYSAKPEEIERSSASWRRSAKNLPPFHFGQPRTPFPMEISGILETGQIKQESKKLQTDTAKKPQEIKKKENGKDLGIISNSTNIPLFHGMQLFFRQSELAHQDLRLLIQGITPMAVFAGSEFCKGNTLEPIKLKKLSNVLVLAGMLLDWTGHRKEQYMNEYPYLFGQMLKAADGLHELYCVIVRNNGKANNFPPQFIGGSLYASATVNPSRAFEQLQLRMLPYLNWAKTHRNEKYILLGQDGKPIEQDGKPIYSRSAGYYLMVFSQIADKLTEVFTKRERFTDEEKAQLFIGYLASLPTRKESNTTTSDQTD